MCDDGQEENNYLSEEQRQNVEEFVRGAEEYQEQQDQEDGSTDEED